MIDVKWSLIRVLDFFNPGLSRWTQWRARRAAQEHEGPGLLVSAHYPPDYFRLGDVDPAFVILQARLDGRPLDMEHLTTWGVVFCPASAGYHVLSLYDMGVRKKGGEPRMNMTVHVDPSPYVLTWVRLHPPIWWFGIRRNRPLRRDVSSIAGASTK